MKQSRNTTPASMEETNPIRRDSRKEPDLQHGSWRPAQWMRRLVVQAATGRMRRGVVIEQTRGREPEKGGGGAALGTVEIGFSGACSGLGFKRVGL
jgi:hypothetical protein